VLLLWMALTSALWITADCCPALEAQLNQIDGKYRERFLPRHAITLGHRLKLWPECWRLMMPDKERYALWDKLRLHAPHEASIGWEEIAEVADFLRDKNVQDGEVIAWYDSPHAVYLLLDKQPGFRFMHVYTAISISVADDSRGVVGFNMMLDELNSKKARDAKYVISDLQWVAMSAHTPEDLAAFLGPACKPPERLMPCKTPYPTEFPFNEPTIFRSRNNTGRYIVHKIVKRDDDDRRK
jgi:hypothetical protein